MTNPELPRWRRTLADKLTRGRHTELENEVRRLTVERDLAEADLGAARHIIETDPDRRASTTLGAVLHRATRADGMATIRVPVTVLDHWLTEHHLASTGRAEQLADTPIPEPKLGPGDRNALPPNPTYAGAVS